MDWIIFLSGPFMANNISIVLPLSLFLVILAFVAVLYFMFNL